MKNFILKNKPLIIALFSMILLLIFTGESKAATDKYIFIGDSRTYHMIGGYANTDDYDKKSNYKEGYALGSFSGKVIKSFGIAGATYPTYFRTKGYLSTESIKRFNDIKSALKSADAGTKVIIWLGVNDLNNSWNYLSDGNVSDSEGTPENKADQENTIQKEE